MSKIAIAAVVCLTAAFFFGLGYQTGYDPPPPANYVPLPPVQPERELTGAAADVRDTLLIADPLERMKKLSTLLQGLEADAIPAVRDGFDAVFLDVSEMELRLLALWWARLEPQTAFRWSMVQWTGSSVMNEVIRAWAARDPESARGALLALTVSPGRYRSAAQALIQGWDESGQPGLGEFMRQLPAGADRQRVISVVTRRKVLRDGVEETTRWVEGLPEDQPPDRFKLQSYRRVASAITSLDPEQGAAWAEERGEGEYGDGLYRRVVSRWAEVDGEAAMNWLGTLPDGPRRGRGGARGLQALYQSQPRRGDGLDGESTDGALDRARPCPLRDDLVAHRYPRRDRDRRSVRSRDAEGRDPRADRPRMDGTRAGARQGVDRVQRHVGDGQGSGAHAAPAPEGPTTTAAGRRQRALGSVICLSRSALRGEPSSIAPVDSRLRISSARAVASAAGSASPLRR